MRLFPKGALVFEIGACIGDMVEGFLAHGAGWVVAVEPEEEDVEYMRRRFAHQGTVAFQTAAVGPEMGTAILSINKGARSCSTLVPDVAWGEDTLLRGMQAHERRTVPMITLDSLISGYGVPDLVNMTVVRFEYQALCGLSQPLPHLAFAVTHATIQEGWAEKAIDRIIEISPSSIFNYTNRSVLTRDSEGDAAPLRWASWKGPESIKRIFPEINELGLWGSICVRMM
jgi:FkbM family methyltransferase